MKESELKILYRSVNDLIPYANNARTHSEDQVNQIASSIKEFGFNNPILVDEQGGVIAGHGRLLAAKKLGLKVIPTIELPDYLRLRRRHLFSQTIELLLIPVGILIS